MAKEDIQRFAEITCEDPGSFAGYTLRNRLPDILRFIVKNNALTRSNEAKLMHILEEMQCGTISPLARQEISHALWEDSMRMNLGRAWKEVGFYFAEAYLYRRIAEICHWPSDADAVAFDPFLVAKKEDITSGLEFFERLSARHLENTAHKTSNRSATMVLKWMLWGNRSDLSQVQWTQKEKRDRKGAIDKDAMVVDHSEATAAYLCNPPHRIDIIADNAGVELFSDLVFAHAMAVTAGVTQVLLHVKPYPTFVSDATVPDVYTLLTWLQVQPEAQAVPDFAREVLQCIDSGTIRIVTHDYWNAPLHFYDMPGDLRATLADSGFIVVKGDANYRRLLGDRHIPADADICRLVDYLPAPAVAVRVLKSELVAGIPEAQQRRLTVQDPRWMVNGRYGMIQLIEKRG